MSFFFRFFDVFFTPDNPHFYTKIKPSFLSKPPNISAFRHISLYNIDLCHRTLSPPLYTIYGILPGLPIYTFNCDFGAKMGLFLKLVFNIDISYFIGNPRKCRNVIELSKKQTLLKFFNSRCRYQYCNDVLGLRRDL